MIVPEPVPGKDHGNRLDHAKAPGATCRGVGFGQGDWLGHEENATEIMARVLSGIPFFAPLLVHLGGRLQKNVRHREMKPQVARPWELSRLEEEGASL